MSTPSLPPPVFPGDRRHPAPRRDTGAQIEPDRNWSAHPAFAAPESAVDRPDWRRIFSAIFRRKWFVLGVLVAGLGGAAFVWRSLPPEYRTEGAIWVHTESQLGTPSAGPGSLLRSSSWVELAESFAVLDSVAVERDRYLAHHPRDSLLFQDPAIAPEGVRPGSYLLGFEDGGRSYTIFNAEGTPLERGATGAGMGANLGVTFTADSTYARLLRSDARVSFTLLTPRDAALSIQRRLDSGIDQGGAFLVFQMSGTNPREIAGTLNAIMERLVGLATDLKEGKILETEELLGEQLARAQAELDSANTAYTAYLERTIVLPSQGGPAGGGAPLQGSYFELQSQLSGYDWEFQRIRTLLSDTVLNPVEIQFLPTASTSTPLQNTLQQLQEARTEYEVLGISLRDATTPMQNLRTRIQGLERQARAILFDIQSQLDRRIQDLRGQIGSIEDQLQGIPARATQERQLASRVATAEALHTAILDRYNETRVGAMAIQPDLELITRAQVPQFPTNDQRIRLVLILLTGALGIGLAGAILLDRLDPRLRYPSQVRGELGLDILGMIPRFPRRFKKPDELDSVFEAYRELRVTLSYTTQGVRPLIMTVSSPAQSEGKTVTSANLALAFAETGLRTVLVDGDTRRGNAHQFFKANRKPGLTDYLANGERPLHLRPTQHENLDFLPSGSRMTHSPELLSSDRMTQLLEELGSTHDVVIVDSPPFEAGSDPFVLATLTGNLAIVLRAGSTNSDLTSAKLESVFRLPIRVLGAILNDVPPTSPHYRYYAHYSSDYRIKSSEVEERKLLVFRGGR